MAEAGCRGLKATSHLVSDETAKVMDCPRDHICGTAAVHLLADVLVPCLVGPRRPMSCSWVAMTCAAPASCNRFIFFEVRVSRWGRAGIGGDLNRRQADAA